MFNDVDDDGIYILNNSSQTRLSSTYYDIPPLIAHQIEVVAIKRHELVC